jgi:methylmalonyl-CoA/ethylmalonyl-CoA epimerase
MADAKIKKFHHVSLAVNDAEKVMSTWSKVLGVGPWTSTDLSGTDAKGRPWKAKEYWAEVGDVVIEIIEPVEGRIVQSRFLDEVGPGLHHVAFQVEDVEQSLAALQEEGAELIVHNPGSFAYVRTGGPDGAVIEISQH